MICNYILPVIGCEATGYGVVCTLCSPCSICYSGVDIPLYESSLFHPIHMVLSLLLFIVAHFMLMMLKSLQHLVVIATIRLRVLCILLTVNCGTGIGWRAIHKYVIWMEVNDEIHF